MKRKLTANVKQFLFQNRWKVKKSDYSGEALEYLLRLRRASKAAKKRKDNTAIIGNTKIPRNSDLYRIIEASAKLKNQTVKDFIRTNQDAIEKLAKDGNVVISRETDYAITDINKLPKSRKIFINGERVSKEDAIFALQNLQSTSANVSNIVVLNYEMKYDLQGDLYMDLPLPETYEQILDDIEEYQDSGDPELEGEAMNLWFEFLDQYDNIVYIKS